MTSPARRRTARRGKAHSLAAACSRRCPDRYWNLASITVYLRSPYASAGSLPQKKKSRPHAKNSKKRRRKEIPQRRFFSAERTAAAGTAYGTQEANLNDAMRVDQFHLPLLFKYSLVYQKVQSSLGSIAIAE